MSLPSSLKKYDNSFPDCINCRQQHCYPMYTCIKEEILSKGNWEGTLRLDALYMARTHVL